MTINPSTLSIHKFALVIWRLAPHTAFNFEGASRTVDAGTATTWGVVLLIILRIFEWLRDLTQKSTKQEDHANEQVMAQFRLSTDERKENLATINTLAGILAGGFSSIERIAGVQTQMLENLLSQQKIAEKTAATLHEAFDSIEALRSAMDGVKRTLDAHVAAASTGIADATIAASISDTNAQSLRVLDSRLSSLIARIDSRLIPVQVVEEKPKTVPIDTSGIRHEL